MDATGISQCICDASFYSSDKSTNCHSCETFKMTKKKGVILADKRILTSSLGVIIAVPLALLLVAIFVLLVFRYACEREIAIAIGEVEWTGDWPGFVGGAPGCGCTRYSSMQ